MQDQCRPRTHYGYWLWFFVRKTQICRFSYKSPPRVTKAWRKFGIQNALGSHLEKIYPLSGWLVQIGNIITGILLPDDGQTTFSANRRLFEQLHGWGLNFRALQNTL